MCIRDSHPWGQRRGFAFDPKVDWQPRRARVLEQAGQFSQAGLWFECQRVVARAKDAEHAAHFRHRLAADRLDRAKVVGLPLVLRSKPATDRLGLDDDDACLLYTSRCV